MSRTQTLLLFALVYSICQVTTGYYFYGFNHLAYLNPDHDNCLVEIAYGEKSTSLQFQQSRQSSDCPTQKLQFTSFFNGEADPHTSIDFNHFNSNDVATVLLAPLAIKSMDGTACVLIPTDFFPYSLHLCSMTYAGMQIYIEVYGVNSDYLITELGTLLIPGYSTYVSSDFWYDYLYPKDGFPTTIMVGVLQNSCSASGASISNLTNSIAFSLNMNAMSEITGMYPLYAMLKRNGATETGDYQIVRIPYVNSTITKNGGNLQNGCYNIALEYSAIIPNASYCKDGCTMSIIYTNNDSMIFVMQFSSFKTLTTLPANPTNSTTTSGNNSTNNGSSSNGNSTTGTTGNNSNGNSGNTGNNNTNDPNNTDNTVNGSSGVTGGINGQNKNLQESSSNNNSILILAIVIPVIACLIVSLLALFCCYKKGCFNRTGKTPSEELPFSKPVDSGMGMVKPIDSGVPITKPIDVGVAGIAPPMIQDPPRNRQFLPNGLVSQAFAESHVFKPPVPVLYAPNLAESEALRKQKIPDAYCCLICRTKVADIALSPCFHTITCHNCVKQLMVCPVCNLDIEDRHMLIYPTIQDYKKSLHPGLFENVQRNADNGGEHLCFNCLNRNINTAFIPCGHLYGCDGCAASLENCPLCKAKVISVNRLTFLTRV